jgi:hypothetical protein
MALGNLRRPLLVSGDDRLDQVAMLLAGERPLVEPEHVDPGEKTEPIVDLQ